MNDDFGIPTIPVAVTSIEDIDELAGDMQILGEGWKSKRGKRMNADYFGEMLVNMSERLYEILGEIEDACGCVAKEVNSD